MKLFTEMIEFD